MSQGTCRSLSLYNGVEGYPGANEKLGTVLRNGEGLREFGRVFQHLVSINLVGESHMKK